MVIFCKNSVYSHHQKIFLDESKILDQILQMKERLQLKYGEIKMKTAF